ncbi:uncharacterized protein BP5553_02715 [Venustampulla echinocandica]|uniref:Uncharacterized protein n=1 Tax=Venustampulla echinocandica TaxID=2656787 RepID=A0A370TS66_9HELO|nr:uncharacterized protein BP5553_02715 [Venustampulla echinocandica]RDL38375.1 hypothetical protein BP5553_02715 [Venustampulla echinocandica]
MPSTSHKDYAPSINSTNTSGSFATTRPLLPNQDQPQASRSQRALEKAKKLLSAIGEPPTAEYDRQQVAQGNKENKEKSVKATKYGVYGAAGPSGGRI